MILQRLGIDVVGGCQLKCVGCPNSTLDRKIRFTSPEDFNRYLSHVNVSRIEFLKLYNFGEITLHPNLRGIFAQIRRQKWIAKHVEVSTNGQIVDGEKLEAIFSSRLVTRFGVSCDGEGSPEEYEELRYGAKWSKFIDFLVLAKKMQEEHSPKTKMFLKIICTGNKSKWESLARGFGYAIQWSVWAKPPDAIRFLDADIRKVLGVCSHVRSTRVRCYVDWDGSVVPCCCHPKAAVFGSLKTQKFTDIYIGSKRKAFIRKLKRDRTAYHACGRCEVK